MDSEVTPYQKQMEKISSSILPQEPKIPPCRKLWLSVINQALFDAVNGGKYEQPEAITWLMTDSFDLSFVCDLAAVEKDPLRKHARNLILRKHPNFIKKYSRFLQITNFSKENNNDNR